jgi:hypothetical protein
MLDFVMLALVAGAFAAAMAYVGACRRIEKHPDLSHEERQ